MLHKPSVSWPIVFLTLGFLSMGTYRVASAAQLALTWIDNSNNEAGFGIERSVGGTASYQPLATVGANVISYTDLNLADNTTYCYRVYAFDSAGNSGYSNDNCATTPAASFTVTVSSAGAGSGTVTSSPAGLTCGNACSSTFVSGTVVTLSAVAAGGSVFAGWSGDAACSTGSITVNANISCTATFNLIPITYTLTLTKAGTGSGTVTSSPAGINCGSTCSASFTSGTAITLSATPASGSTFAGWSGTGCTGGSFTVNANTICTATFNSSLYTLTTSVANQITSSGTASGSIVSNPAGINCGSQCTASYSSSTVVSLTPVAGTNAKFSGWSGDADCTDGSVTMNANKTCTANFVLNYVTLSVSKNGNGTVASTPSGISCGTACSFSFLTGTSVTLHAAPATGFTFSGWSGGCAGTSDCTLTLSGGTTVTANFFNSLVDKIGVYRPSTGEWFLDRSGNDAWDGCIVDLCLQPFAGTNGIPVVGDWNGSGTTKAGLFAPSSAQWLLDINGNGIWDGCGVDTCVHSFGQSTDLPVIGQWATTPHDGIGIFRPAEERWHLDSNDNDILDGCAIDKCPDLSVYQKGDIPVAGDWTGRGSTQLGLFRPSTGQWFLDRNANGKWDGCKKDTCINSFGRPGDLPVTGDWNGTGASKIGVFRPSTGEWFLDLNGNGKWDGPTLDLYVPGFGEPGDVPVVGKW